MRTSSTFPALPYLWLSVIGTPAGAVQAAHLIPSDSPSIATDEPDQSWFPCSGYQAAERVSNAGRPRGLKSAARHAMAHRALKSAARRVRGIAPGQMDEWVEQFFRSEDRGEQLDLLRKIETAADGSLERVERSIGNARLWKTPDERSGSFPIRTGLGREVHVAYQLPHGYDATRAYPLLWCQPFDTLNSRAAIRRVLDLLDRGKQDDDGEPDPVIACPDRPVAGSFHHGPDDVTDLAYVLRAVRRRFHIDENRIYLFGEDAGGDSAWMTALFHADAFAGAILLQSYPGVPYAEQSLPFLLENVNQLPILSVWRAAERRTDPDRDRVVALFNRRLAELAHEMALPYHPFESLVKNHDLPLPRTDFRAILSGRRNPFPRHVRHWFRYPEQGSAFWSSCRTLRPEVWSASQLSVRPGAGKDYDGYLRRSIEERMGWISMDVAGQTITIETRRVDKLDLYLSRELVDLKRPIRVIVNGRTRHSGVVTPNIRTLLMFAHERWRFHHLPSVRLRFSIRRDHAPR